MTERGQLLAHGRTAEVFAWGDRQVLKLDRPDWNGLSHYEVAVLERLHVAGLPVPRPAGAVTIDGRAGMVMERVDGPTLAVDPDDPDGVTRFVALHRRLAIGDPDAVAGLPDLVSRLHDEIGRSTLAATVVAARRTDLEELDDGERVLCHFDFHPENVMITSAGPVVIDWLTAAVGPHIADVARTLVLLREPLRGAVRRASGKPEALRRWVRVVAAARLSEGFSGAEAAELADLAS